MTTCPGGRPLWGSGGSSPCFWGGVVVCIGGHLLMKSSVIIKVLSLAVGLTLGIVLLTRVRLEMNFDSCIEGIDDVYRLTERVETDGNGVIRHDYTSGGVVVKLRDYAPELVTASRSTGWLEKARLVMSDGSKVYARRVSYADSCHFRIFGTEVRGNAREVLATKCMCMVSRSLAEKMGGDVVGRQFYIYPDDSVAITVGGVFEDYDENSTFAGTDVLLALSTIGVFSYDGSEGMLGNDRYLSLVRLRSDADINKVEAECRKMLEAELPWDMIKEGGYKDLGIEFVNAREYHLSESRVSSYCVILSVVAIVILFTAVMNYVLVIFGTLAGRAKRSAVLRSMGADDLDFYKETFTEAGVHLLAALTVMGLLLFACKDEFEPLLGVSLASLFSWQTAWVVIGVCAVVLLTCALLPGYIYSRVPLVFAFRHFSESKRVWKLSLLAFQFALSALLFVVLTSVYMQYDYMLGKDMGYEYDRVVYTEHKLDHSRARMLLDEVQKLPCVESAYLSYSLLCDGQTGDNITIVGENRELFNAANMFFCTPGIVPTMRLKVVHGRAFSDHPADSVAEVLVDETFARKAKELRGIDDVVGMQVHNSSFGDAVFTVVGVLGRFVVADVAKRDERPVFIVNGSRFSKFLSVRLRDDVSHESIAAVQAVCDRLCPDAELDVVPYSVTMSSRYEETLRMRNLLCIGCVSTFIIAVIGLMGYIRNEVQRRSRELAIRKVLGASVMQLQALFIGNIAVIALPSIVVGTLGGLYCNGIIMEQFGDKVTVSPWVYAAVAVGMLALVFLLVLIKTSKLLTRNPMESIKTE